MFKVVKNVKKYSWKKSNIDYHSVFHCVHGVLILVGKVILKMAALDFIKQLAALIQSFGVSLSASTLTLTPLNFVNDYSTAKIYTYLEKKKT